MKKIFFVLCMLALLVALLPFSGVKAMNTLEPSTDRFAVELSTDPFLKSLVELKNAANGIDSGSDLLVGTYLRTTVWYTQESKRIANDPVLVNKFEGALRHVDYMSNRFPGQKVQCVGLVALVAGMDNRFFEISGLDFYLVRELLPVEIKSRLWSSVWSNGYHALVINQLDQVNVGDLILIYFTNTGHISAVVGKKTVDGETVLLVISGNEAKDGKVEIFEVDKENFSDVFGSFPHRKVVIRTN